MLDTAPIPMSPPMVMLRTVVTTEIPVALASLPPHQRPPIVALDAGALLPSLDHEVRHGVSAVASARVMNHFFMLGPPQR
jgi:hypothetical protein